MRLPSLRDTATRKRPYSTFIYLVVISLTGSLKGWSRFMPGGCKHSRTPFLRQEVSHECIRRETCSFRRSVDMAARCHLLRPGTNVLASGAASASPFFGDEASDAGGRAQNARGRGQSGAHGTPTARCLCRHGERTRKQRSRTGVAVANLCS